MHKNKKLFLICFVAAILLVGCKGKPIPAMATSISTTQVPSILASLTPTNTTTETAIPIATSTNTPNATLIAKPTATKRVTPTTAPLIPPEANLLLQCLEVQPTIPEEAVLNGSLIMRNENPNRGVLLLDMVNRQMTEFGFQNENYFDIAISLDKSFIAIGNGVYDAGTQIRNELIIATVDGQPQQVIPWEDSWLSMEGWTTDHRLLFTSNQAAFNTAGEQISPFSYLVIDPFSRTSQTLQQDFPDFFDITTARGSNNWYDVVYDPGFTRAVYLRYTEDNKEQFTYALWDLENNQLLATFEEIYLHHSVFANSSAIKPVWSSDGSRFAIVSQKMLSDTLVEFELYQVSRDGQAERLTNLTPVAVLQGLNFSWSPDGSKIAMLLDTWYDVEQSRLAVLDVETQNVIDYCIPIDDGPYPGDPLTPVWSPEGNQLLFVDHQRVIWVDLVYGTAAVIAEEMLPAGWVFNKP